MKSILKVIATCFDILQKRQIKMYCVMNIYSIYFIMTTIRIMNIFLKNLKKKINFLKEEHINDYFRCIK